MDNQEFDRLWQMAGAEQTASRMAAEYPAWLAKRRRAMGMVAAALVVAMVSVPLLVPSTTKDYDHVYCNRSGGTDAQWAALAADLLMENA
jgi:hypothetical protein